MSAMNFATIDQLHSGRDRMDTLMPSKPGSYWQLLKHSFALYRASFSKVIILSLLLSFTVFTPRFLSTIAGQDIFLDLPPLSPHRLWLFLIELIGITFFIGILWHIHCVATRVREPLIEDLTVGVKKVFLVLIASILQFGIIFGIALLFWGIQIFFYKHQMLLASEPSGAILTVILLVGQLILMLYFSVLFIFLIPIIATENKSILSAFERTVYLGWNHWLRIFSLQITPWITYVIILLLIRHAIGVNVHIYFFAPPEYSVWTSVFHFVIFALFIIWPAALLLVQLKDLELRKHIVAS
jgi:hypothetical protein